MELIQIVSLFIVLALAAALPLVLLLNAAADQEELRRTDAAR